MAFAFDDIPSMATLAFRGYTGGHDSGQWWSYIIEYIIIIFPALDVFSAFPILAIALSDNITSLYYSNIPKDMVPKRGVITIKAIMLAIPFTIAAIEYDLVIFN